ncbi:MAG: AI-2E family transporter [bacterium]
MYLEKLQKLSIYLLWTILLILLYKTSLFFIDILSIYFITLFLSIVIKPQVDQITNKIGISRDFATLIIILLFFGFIITLILILIPSIYESIKDIAKTLQENINSIFISSINFFNNYLYFLGTKINYSEVYQNILNQINQNIPKILERMIDIFLGGWKIIFNILLVAVLTFYTIKDYEKIKSYKAKLVSKIFNIPISNLESIISESETIIRKFILGQIFAATYIFLFTLISLYLFNVKQYFIAALIAGIFELIPFIGAFVAFTISIIFLLNKGIIPVLTFIIIATIAYQILAKIIYPNIVGKILNLSVITVLICILVGFKLYGIFGMFIAVPTISIIKNIVDKKLNNDK